MGALSLFTRVFAPSGSQVKVDPRRCLRNRLRGNRCDLCLQICPTAALTYSGGSLHFADDACSNCLGCAAVCPVDALTASIDLQHFVDKIKSAEPTTVLLSCDSNRLFHENELLLPCLGMFSHELLVTLASAVPQKRLRFNIRGCENCCNGKVSRWFQNNLNNLLQYSNDTSVSKMDFVTFDSGEQARGDRRSFFKAMQRGAINAAASSHTAGKQKKQQTATSRTISSKTSLLKNALESHKPPHPLAARMVPQLSVGEKCQPCPRCAGICPTGALRLVRQEKEKKLVFESTSCCSCALCVDFCKNEALALSCSLKI